MALSEAAEALLDQLEANRAANPATLRKRLGWSEEQFEAQAAELCRTGLAEQRGKRLARIGPDATVSPAAETLLAALPADGSTVGGLRLRSSLDLDNETFTNAKKELREAGLIEVGPGYGGTVARAKAETDLAPHSRLSRLVAKESDLYDPFLDWLRAALADQPGFAHAKKMATPKGWKAKSGKWTRPDLVAVQVVAYEWLPDRKVELFSYEVKRFPDAQKLESVYEAAAHGRWAHRASLVVELDPEAAALPDAVLAEIRRFRLGLYVMRARDGGGFDIREEIEPPRTEDAAAEDVNELIGTFLGSDERVRNDYRISIGKG